MPAPQRLRNGILTGTPPLSFPFLSLQQAQKRRHTSVNVEGWPNSRRIPAADTRTDSDRPRGSLTAPTDDDLTRN